MTGTITNATPLAQLHQKSSNSRGFKVIQLNDWDDYFKLQQYLRTYYLQPHDAELVKHNALETHEAFRREWPGHLLSALFGNWIPFGVRQPQPGQQNIQIMDQPFFTDLTSFINYDDLTHDDLGLLYYDDYPILFWRISGPLPPIHHLLHVNYESGDKPCNLWDDTAVFALLKKSNAKRVSRS